MILGFKQSCIFRVVAVAEALTVSEATGVLEHLANLYSLRFPNAACGTWV